MKRTEEARQYEAKAKELRRQERAFWNEVKEREEEVKRFLLVGQKNKNLSDTYGEPEGIHESSDKWSY